MIFSKTPLRMSFVGGGSDMPEFYRQFGGAVLSTAIARYIYIAVNRKFDGRIRLSYSKTEEVDARSDIHHPLVRHCLELADIDGGIEIGSFADIPSKGTGLGSSSSYTVGLLNALYAYKSQYAAKEQLAREACHVEIDRCGEPIGKQDQYAAAFGGLNIIEFHPDDSVSVCPIVCDADTRKAFEERIIVFFTGRTRSASEVLARQSAAIKTGNPATSLKRMVELVFEMKKALESGGLEDVGGLLHENWRLKSQLTSGISDNEIDQWYQAGIDAGAMGGKLLGAGNGGFMMFYAEPERHAAIRAALNDLTQTSFGFDRQGSQIAFYQPVSE
jgi:D-glycero-alpha-D-manno-heptose-7-phosphate kinase